MVLIDTSVWIESLRKRGDMLVKLAVENLLDVYEAQWCSPVRLELIGGARKEERQALAMHFSVIPYRACREDDWERALSLAWKLRQEGLSLPWMDILIAAIAIHDDVRLYSIDAHFEKIAGLTTLKLYRPGYGGAYVMDTDDG
jgi:predicted nucleic acid-binding protein